MNKMFPSLIRTESDQLTYGLHIILRFEIEQEMINGKLAIKDVRDSWNERMSDLLGVEVPNDTHGVLQDIHWQAAASATSRRTDRQRDQPQAWEMSARHPEHLRSVPARATSARCATGRRSTCITSAVSSARARPPRSFPAAR